MKTDLSSLEKLILISIKILINKTSFKNENLKLLIFSATWALANTHGSNDIKNRLPICIQDDKMWSDTTPPLRHK